MNAIDLQRMRQMRFHDSSRGGQLGDTCTWNGSYYANEAGGFCTPGSTGTWGGGGGSNTNPVPVGPPIPATGGTQHYFDNIVGILSQAFSAWGHTPTQQIGPGGLPIGGGYSPAAQNQSIAQILAAANQQNANNAAGGYQGGGGTLEQAFGGITSFVSNNPLPVFGGILVLFLLFKQPPGKR